MTLVGMGWVVKPGCLDGAGVLPARNLEEREVDRGKGYQRDCMAVAEKVPGHQ